MVGILDIFDDESAGFLEFLDLVKGIGQIVADSLVKTRLLTDLALQNRLMSELVELGAIVPGAADVGAAFSSLGSRLIETIDADTCELYSLQGDRIELLAGFDRDGLVDPWIGWTGDIRDFPAAPRRCRAARCSSSLRPPTPGFPPTSASATPSSTTRARSACRSWSTGRPSAFSTSSTRGRATSSSSRLPAGLLAGAGPHHPECRAVRELERRNAALRDLVQLGELVTQVSDVGELLRLAALRLLVTLDATFCEVYRVDAGELVQLVSVGPEGFGDDDNGWRAPLSQYPGYAAALAEGGPWIIASPDDPRLSAAEIDWYRTLGPEEHPFDPAHRERQSPRRDRHRGLARARLRRASRLHAQRRPAPRRRPEKALLLGRLEDGNRELRQLVDASLEFGASLEMDDVPAFGGGRACASPPRRPAATSTRSRAMSKWPGEHRGRRLGRPGLRRHDLPHRRHEHHASGHGAPAADRGGRHGDRRARQRARARRVAPVRLSLRPRDPAHHRRRGGRLRRGVRRHPARLRPWRRCCTTRPGAAQALANAALTPSSKRPPGA